MRRCPKCGKESGEEFHYCPECGTPLTSSKRVSEWSLAHGTRNLLVALAAVAVVLILAVAILPSVFTGVFLGSMGLGSGPPTGIEGTIFGNRTAGYTVVFFLTDTSRQFVLSHGNVTFSIQDATFSKPLYSSSFTVTEDDFKWWNVSAFGVSGPGYLWEVPPGAVKAPQIPAFGGEATITFFSPSGLHLWIGLNLRGDNLTSTGEFRSYSVQ